MRLESWPHTCQCTWCPWLREGVVSVLNQWKWKALVTQSCLTFCSPRNCSLPDSSVHGILQARILEWVAIPVSRRTSQLRNGTSVSCTVGSFFTIWATGEALFMVVQFSSVAQLCPTLCNPVNCSTPGLPITNSQSSLKLQNHCR